MNIPKHWCIKARNKKEEKIVNDYARKTGGYHWNEERNYARTHYLCISGKKYNSGRLLVEDQFTEISFEDFKRYILNQPEKSIDLW